MHFLVSNGQYAYFPDFVRLDDLALQSDDCDFLQKLDTFWFLRGALQQLPFSESHEFKQTNGSEIDDLVFEFKQAQQLIEFGTDDGKIVCE